MAELTNAQAVKYAALLIQLQQAGKESPQRLKMLTYGLGMCLVTKALMRPMQDWLFGVVAIPTSAAQAFQAAVTPFDYLRAGADYGVQLTGLSAPTDAQLHALVTAAQSAVAQVKLK